MLTSLSQYQIPTWFPGPVNLKGFRLERNIIISISNLKELISQPHFTMENEPDIGRENLIQTIHLEYDIDIQNLVFHQRGWGGDSYIAETSAGKRYFLKLKNQERNNVFAASSQAFYLPLMHQLYINGIMPHIPHPIPTLKGEFSLGIDGQELMITSFIEGEDVGFGKLPESIITQLAERVGIFHSCRNQLTFESPFVEKFEIAFEPMLLQLADELAAISSTHRKGKILLRDTLVPRSADLYMYLDWLKELQKQVKTTGNRMVICHTDLHGGNLMTDNQNNLYILDWENAMIAPREQDMIFFAGERDIWKIFWPKYRSFFDPVDLDRDLLRFYFYRRGLEDIADYIFRIFQSDGSDERDESDVKELTDCLDGLEDVERTVSDIWAGFE